jgi:Tfp pilus assembly protein PilX
MPVKMTSALRRLSRRLASEDGFTIPIALGVLVVTSLLAVAAYGAVQADLPLAQRDLEGKRAYYAARAGVNKFLYELNQNPSYWQGCPQQTTPVALYPGSAQKYSFNAIPANGSSLTGCASDPTQTLVDTDSSTFRYQFIGYSGGGTSQSPSVSRGLVASFRKDTPLDYLWYTIYETLDPNTYNNPLTYADCAAFHRPTPSNPGGRPSHCRDIVWPTGDVVDGPMYTADQYMIDSSQSAPVFGRDSEDQIESSVPDTNPNAVCTDSNCRSAVFQGEKAPNAPAISPPPDNTLLEDDAVRYGIKYNGVTDITLNGTTATIVNCPTSTTCTTTASLPIGKYPSRKPVIYVNNITGVGACDANAQKYSPYNVAYPTYGPCGNVYVSGNYSNSLTIAADNDIIIDGNITHSGNTPVLGLVANNFVRVMHGMTPRPSYPNTDQDECGGATNQTSSPDQTLTDPTIDAAILALRHSFIVDNYDCGATMGTLHITGAIAQLFRGTVGIVGPTHGYQKDYSYDDRFTVTLPPYLFDVFNSSWHIARETLCVPAGAATPTKCPVP